MTLRPFSQALEANGCALTRGDRCETVQINVGRACNLACRHCHLDAGPARNEMMDRPTMAEVIDFVSRFSFVTADITGGAPELVPDLPWLLTELRPLVERLLLRTNLTLLLAPEYGALLDLMRKLKVTLVASFPSVNEKQADAQRGRGVWHDSITMLRQLNEMGYGMPGSDLALYLVANPAGAFLPSDQCAAEKKFRADLARRWSIHFSRLFTFANVPLGRFLAWLQSSGNYDRYMAKLGDNFNPQTVPGLMCRTLISVGWDGVLYDCDFNLAAGLPYSGQPRHVSQVREIPAGGPIMTGLYCYACTAGAGFT